MLALCFPHCQQQSKYLQTGRTIDFVLKKKEDGPFWPHLTKLKQRYHWLKVNFNKWKEEDDSDLELEQEDNFEEVSYILLGKGASKLSFRFPNSVVRLTLYLFSFKLSF